MLREAAPKISRVAAYYGSGEDYVGLALPRLEQAARALGITIIRIELHGPDDVDRAWTAIERSRAEALIGFGAAALFTRREMLLRSTRARMPTIFSDRQYVEDGALMAYGIDLANNFRTAAGYVDRILKGAKPADLPMEHPSRYFLAINLDTAKAIGITMPPALLLQADYVIGGR